MLEIQHLTKSYGRALILDHLDAKLEKGQVVGIIGPNGSGKTTLIKCLLGLTTPQHGEILFNGTYTANQSKYLTAFGYMPQTGRYPDNMKISQLIEMIRDIREDSVSDTDDELFDAYKLKEISHQTLGSLSGGTIQKVSAALAFMFRPEVLILDEPTAGLDPLAAEVLKEKIQKEAGNKLIIITSHIMNDLEELATHILFINDHKIRLFENIASLKHQYGDIRLGKIISKLMESQRKEEHSA